MASSSSSQDEHVFLITLLLLIVAPLNSKAIEPQKISFNPKVEVEIFNALEGESNLTLHCKSKNDDLGFHTLQSGQGYQFEFHPNFFTSNTLFFCSFAWPEDPSLHYFDIYIQRFDRCSYCPWQVHKENVCGYRGPVPHLDCYPYNKSFKKEAPPGV